MALLRLGLAATLLSLLVPGLAVTASPLPLADAADPVIVRLSPGGDLQSALNTVPDGGIIELSAGTYPGGFSINNPQRGFTVRAAPNATVVLDGQHAQRVLNFQNSSLADAGPMTFSGLTFANGATGTDGLAAGVTMYRAQATFIDCTFANNAATVNTVGGAVYVAEGSTAFFFNTLWRDNSSTSGGAGLGIRSQARVYVHNSRFIHNTGIATSAGSMPSGGGVNMADSLLRISNTRFENNSVAGHGGALYVIGTWNGTPAQPAADVIIANSTFVNNSALRDAGLPANPPSQGGAINVEDQALARIYNSRFITNRSMIGGAINLYRARLELHSSVFQGNSVSGPSISNTNSGAIAGFSADGVNNRPTSQLFMDDSLIQGAYGSVSTVAPAAGGILIGGNAVARARADLNRVALYNLVVTPVSSAESPVGGALEATNTDLSMQNSMVLRSAAKGGSWAGGGGAILYLGTIANIQNSTFAGNSADRAGGAIYVHASTLNLGSSLLFGNAVSPASAGGVETSSLGAAVFAAPDAPTNSGAHGSVAGNTFAGNTGLTIFDDDRQNSTAPAAINDVHYNNNAFYEALYPDRAVYLDVLPGQAPQTPAGLNALVVQRASGLPATDKGQGNVQLGSSPIAGQLLAVPPVVLPAGAAGDPAGPTAAYLVYAANGGSATLDGVALADKTGLQQGVSAGTHSLVVGGKTYSAAVAAGQAPAAAFGATLSGTTTTLSWALQSGSFLDAAIDHGVSIPSSPTGSLQVATPVKTAYRFYMITQEGGYLSLNGSAPQLSLPASMTSLAGQNLPLTHGSLQLTNAGGGVLTWTARTGGDLAGRIALVATSGQIATTGAVNFTVNATGLALGTYSGYVEVNAGAAGTKQVALTLKMVSQVHLRNFPIIGRP